jgi:hypothetical protein
MNNITLFSQIISQIDRQKFNFIVKERQTDKHSKGYNSWTHFVSMLFCQFAKSQSVRDISNGLRSATGNLNHLGIQHAPSKSTISYQNERRDFNLFREYYYFLYNQLGQHPDYKRRKFKIKSKILLLDSSTIGLCLSLYDWAKYKTSKGAIKMHTLLDYDGGLPVYMNLTDGKTADNKAAYDIPLSAGSVVVADRFYNDFTLLNNWDSIGVKFVIRHKENLKFKIKRNRPVDRTLHPNIISDQTIHFSGIKSTRKYPKVLRRVVVWNQEHQMEIELITNQMKWSAATIAELYKSRWQVEIFFRDIKQALNIKSFIGTSENAVQIQIWTALITILLLKAMKMRAKYRWHMSNLVAFIRLNIFVKIDLQEWLDNPFKPPEIRIKTNQIYKQGVLF